MTDVIYSEKLKVIDRVIYCHPIIKRFQLPPIQPIKSFTSIQTCVVTCHHLKVKYQLTQIYICMYAHTLLTQLSWLFLLLVHHNLSYHTNIKGVKSPLCYLLIPSIAVKTPVSGQEEILQMVKSHILSVL